MLSALDSHPGLIELSSSVSLLWLVSLEHLEWWVSGNVHRWVTPEHRYGLANASAAVNDRSDRLFSANQSSGFAGGPAIVALGDCKSVPCSAECAPAGFSNLNAAQQQH